MKSGVGGRPIKKQLYKSPVSAETPHAASVLIMDSESAC